MAAPAELRVGGAEVSLAEARPPPRPLLPVQPHGHAGRVRPEGGAPGCGEDEEMSAQTGQTNVHPSLSNVFPCPLGQWFSNNFFYECTLIKIFFQQSTPFTSTTRIEKNENDYK